MASQTKIGTRAAMRGKRRLEIPSRLVAHEHRPNGPPPVLNQPRDHDPAFRDEEVLRPQECRLRDAAVVGHPRVLGREDPFEHEPTIRTGPRSKAGQY